MANDSITPFQLKWEEKFIAATEKHIDLFRKAGAALNDHLDHSQFGSIPQRELNLHDHSKFSEAELPHYARRFFGPNDDPAGWQRALVHHYRSNQHHWQCWLDGFEKPGDEAQCTAREMPAEQCLILVTDWLATRKQITGSWVLTGWLINNLCGHEPKIILHQETRLAIDNILAAIGYWTNFDNVPLYCLTNNEFIGMLEGY